MKILILLFVVATVLLVECNHRFIGTNVNRPLVYHHNVEYGSYLFRKRVENLYFMMPQVPSNFGRSIQGILAVDLKNSEATANVTQGGIGYNFVNLRLKSERGKGIHYDVYIYA